jgi:4-amino-4-deoxy-L-arabinose transferase-like glycosyltransferase
VPAPSPVSPVEPTTVYRAATAAILALTVLRVVALLLNRTDLFVDEAQYWDWSRALAPGYYSKPPLIAWVIALTTGLFGDAEWAVRLAAPLLHGVTALTLAALGRRLYGPAAGALAGLVYATLPAVSLSSALISTDVPLLTCWSVALLLYTRWLDGNRWRDAIGLGLALALGLNAKYAMGFFVMATLIHLGSDRALRPRLASPRLWLAILIGVAALAPNVLWNLANGNPTFAHTQENIGWGRHFDPRHVLDFVASQFGVFGPVALTVLVLAGLGRLRTERRDADRLLLAFSLPILAVFVGEAIIARAYANWAATAYPAAAVLVGALMAAPAARWWRRLSFAIAGLAALVMLVAPTVAPQLTRAGLGGPLSRLLGWSDYAAALSPILDKDGVRTVIVGNRDAAAGLLYQLRRRDVVVVTAPFEGAPRHHFQLSRPWRADLPRPALLLDRPGAAMPAPLAAAGPAVTLPVARAVEPGRAIAAQPVTW